MTNETKTKQKTRVATGVAIAIVALVAGGSAYAIMAVGSQSIWKNAMGTANSNSVTNNTTSKGGAANGGGGTCNRALGGCTADKDCCQGLKCKNQPWGQKKVCQSANAPLCRGKLLPCAIDQDCCGKKCERVCPGPKILGRCTVPRLPQKLCK